MFNDQQMHTIERVLDLITETSGLALHDMQLNAEELNVEQLAFVTIVRESPTISHYLQTKYARTVGELPSGNDSYIDYADPAYDKS